MSNLIAYSIGIVSASVCVSKELMHKEIESIMNTEHPTMISSKWSISKDKTFKGGESNPCVCEEHPETRLHYLMNC